MANYNIDVKAKVNVSQLKSSIQESLNKTTIPVKPKFTPSVDDNNIKVFRNTVANYFQKEPIPIVFAEPSQNNIAKILGEINKKFIITPTLKFDTNKSSEFATQLNTIKQAIDEFGKNSKANVSFSVDPESYKQLFQTINNIKEEQKKISNLDISLGFDQKEKERLSDEITAIYALLKGLNNLGNSITVTEPNTENLSNIKDKIQQYFQNNPITLFISQQLNDVEMGSIAEKVKELLQLQNDIQEQELQKQQQSIKETSNIQQEEIDKQIEKFKALEVEYDKHLIEKRELRDKEKQESEEHMQEMILAEKKLNEEQLQNNKHLLDEKALNYLEHANQLQEISKTTVEAIENNSKQSDFLSIYIQEIEQIVDAFRQGAINIEQVQDQISAKMSEAGQKGIIPQEVFDNTKKLLNNLEEEAGKSFDDWRKKQEKLYRDLQVLTENQKKYDEKIWEDKAKSVQQMYNKQQISAEQYISRMNSLLPEAYEKGYDSAEKYSKAVDNVKKEQNEASQSADDLGNSVNNLGSSFDNAFNSLMRYFGVTKIFDAVQNSFSKMIQEVRDLDVELTEFSKVTDLTSQQTEKFIDDAYALGDTVARTGTEVVQATTLFKKMGYELDESMQFAKDALMWTNVADGIVGVESATNMLISTMKAFEQQGISSTHIIDALNEVSNNYSTSSSALSENLSTVAATLAVSGTSFEQTVGLMTAGIEIMPDKASKVANGLKTISQRIRQIDGDTADKLDDFLGAKGISRYDELTGQLRGTYEILGDVAGIWDQLTENERQYIGEVMAGKNQITVLNALMMNFSTAINATSTAMNSAGSAARENERVLDSIQGHIQRFQSAFEELSKNLINSEVFKQVVDFGTNLIKILNSLTDETWKLVAVFTGAGITGIVGVIQKFNNGFQQAQKEVQTFNKALKDAQQEGKKLDESFKDISKGQYFDSLVSGINIATASIGLFITALTTMIQIRDNIEAEEERRWKENIDNRNQEISKINELKTLEEEYSKSTDPEKRKLLYEKIHDTKVKIANLDIDGLSRTQLLSGEIGKQNDLYDSQILKISSINLELIKQKQQIETNEHAWLFLKHLPGSGSTTPTKLNQDFIKEKYLYNQDYDSFINNTSVSLQDKIDQLEQLQAFLADMLSYADPGTPYYETYIELFEHVQGDIKKIQEMNDEVTSLANEQAKTVLGDLSSYTDEQLNAMSKIFDALSTGSLEDLTEGYLELSDVLGDLGIDYDEFIEKINKIKDPDVAQAAFDLIENFLQLKNASKDASDSVEQVETTLAGAMAMMDEYATNAGILAQAQEDISNTGQITAESLKKIADAGLMAYLTFDEETKSLGVNIEAFEKDNAALEANAIASYVAGQQAQLLEELKGIVAGSMNVSAEATNNDSGALQNLSVAAEEATAENWQLALSAYAASEGIDTTGEKAAEVKAKIDEYSVSIRDGVAAIHSYFGSVSSYSLGTVRGASHSSSSSSSSSSTDRQAEQAQREAEQAAKQAQQAWKDAFKVEYNKLKTYLDSEIITYEQYYAALEELNKHFFEGRSEFEEEYWKYQDEIVKGRKKYLEDELKSYFQKGEKILKHQLNVEYITEEEYYDALTLLYESYYTDKEKYEEEYWKLEEEIYKLRKKQIKELEDELKDLYKEIEDLHKEYVKSLEDDLDEVETTIGYAIDVIDEEINKLKEEKSAIDESNEALQEQIKLQELEDALEKAKNKKTRVYKKGEGFVYEQDITAISQAQTALDKYKQESQHKKRLSNIDEEIKKLEEYKKEWQNISTDYKKAQDEMTAKAILGESAREEVLRREHNAVTKVGNIYVAVKNAIIKANKATIDNLEAYIGDATQAGTFSYEIERIKNKINEIQSKTVTLQVNTSQASTSVTNIMIAIDALRNKLESKYSTQNLNAWLASYKSMINEAYHYNPSGGYSGGGSGSSESSSSSGGNNQSSSGNTNVPDGKPAIGTRVKLKQPNNYAYGDQEFEIWGYDYKGDPQIRWIGSSDKDHPTYAVSLSELEGYDENTDTDTVEPGDTITEDGVYKYADQNGNYMPMDVIWEGGQKYYYNPITGQKIPVVSGGGGEAGVYDGGSGGDDIYYYEPIDWQGQGYDSIGEYYADYRQQMQDYYHNLYGYHASGTTGTKTKKFVINENGIEAMVTPDGTVISAPSTGYGVIKNEYTERLTDFAADPLSFLSKMFTGYSGTYQNNNNAKNEVININGNLTLPNVTDGQSFVDSIRNVALQYTTRRR